MGELTKKYDVVFGIDLGNGLIKVRAVYKNGKPYTFALPSGYADFDELGSTLDERQYRVDTYEINGQKFLWGKDVVNLGGEVIDCHGHERRYTTIPYKYMVKMVLAKIYKDLGITSNDKVLIVTGVPSSETDTVAEEQLRSAFTNDNKVHEVAINGEQLFIKVGAEDIIVLAQPVATVVGRYLNDDGTVADSKYANIKVAVVDIGGGTIDFDIIQGMRRIKKLRFSIPKGFRDVYDAIRNDIQTTHHTANPSDFALLKSLLTGGMTGKFVYLPNQRVEPHDFEDVLNKAVENLSARIQKTITSVWKSQSDIDEILLVGGSATYFEEDIAEVIDGVEVPKNNGNSNVDGYYKLGVCENNKMTESVI